MPERDPIELPEQSRRRLPIVFMKPYKEPERLDAPKPRLGFAKKIAAEALRLWRVIWYED